MLAGLLNGKAISPQQPAIHIDDRGLLYGDGVFETMLLRAGRVRFIDDHLHRLQQGCERLKMSPPVIGQLREELQQLVQQHRDGIVKLILTRGRGGRGYRAVAGDATRLWQLFAPVASVGGGVSLRWCDTRLARNQALAGIKHLNRLEQVLAQSEWDDATINEGLMLDTESELISGTMGNVFLVLENVLVTPDLRFCGVQGVMRKNILRFAAALELPCEERAVRPEELHAASEVFITNAVRGIQPVTTLLPSILNGQQWTVGETTLRLITKLNECHQENHAS